MGELLLLNNVKTLVTIFAFAAIAATRARAQSTINVAEAFAWGANIGWTNWRPSVSDGAVIGEYVCSSSVWSANVGWISLGGGAPANGLQYSNTTGTDYGIAIGNRYGPIVNITAGGGAAAVNGNSAVSTVASTDPWANFSY